MRPHAPAWVDLDDSRPPLLLVPVGAWEQHGPHLPLDTDTRIAVAVATRAAGQLGDEVLVTSPLGITASGEHAGFPGTLSIGTEAMAAMLVEIGRSADWSAGVLLVNGHGGNAEAVHRAVRLLHHERRRIDAWWPGVTDGPADAHAGIVETSVLLAIDPDAVHADRLAPGLTTPLGEIAADLRERGVRALSPSGVLGDPRLATAEHGEQLLATWVDEVVTIARRLLSDR